MGLELAPDLIESGRRKRLTNGDLGTVARRSTSAGIGRSGTVAASINANRLAVSMDERLGILAHDDGVRGRAEIRLEVGDAVARLRVFQPEDESRCLPSPDGAGAL